MISAIEFNYKLFVEKLKLSTFDKLEFELVIYDEVENFRDYRDTLFNYPYQDRKSFISSNVLDPIFSQWDNTAYALDYAGYNYEY
jgi:hypothetical protein